MLSEPAKQAGLTGLMGWSVRSANFFEKTGFFSRPGVEPAGTGQNRPNRSKSAGLDWGLRKLNLKKKNQKIDNVSQTYNAFHLSPLSTLLTNGAVSRS